MHVICCSDSASSILRRCTSKLSLLWEVSQDSQNPFILGFPLRYVNTLILFAGSVHSACANGLVGNFPWSRQFTASKTAIHRVCRFFNFPSLSSLYFPISSIASSTTCSNSPQHLFIPPTYLRSPATAFSISSRFSMYSPRPLQSVATGRTRCGAGESMVLWRESRNRRGEWEGTDRCSSGRRGSRGRLGC